MGAHPISAAVSANVWGVELPAPTHHTDRKRGRGASSWPIAKETEHFVCNVNHYSFLGVIVYSRAESAVSCTQLQEFRLISSDYGRTPTPCSRVARMTKRFVFAASGGTWYRQEQRERNAHSAHGCQCTTALHLQHPPLLLHALIRKICVPHPYPHAAVTRQ